MNIGENIKHMRLEKNMTQGELADKVSVTVSMISQIERGVKVPTILLAKDIAQVFNCNTDDLFKERVS